MKVLSLLQPWATLVVIGAKRIETRSWDTKYRGPILIHASKKMTAEQKHIATHGVFYSKLKHLEELPLGKIIGKVDIYSTSTTSFYLSCKAAKIKLDGGNWETEIQFGDYSDGRFGWLLKNPVSFAHHVPVKGSLGLWDFEERICLGCGCMDHDCQHCIEKTGEPCYWVEANLCSACAQNQKAMDSLKTFNSSLKKHFKV